MLVFAAPAAAGVLDQRDALAPDPRRVRRRSASPRAAPTSSTTPPTPRPTACTRPSGIRPIAAGELDRRTRRAASPVVLIAAVAASITAPINDGKLTGVVAGVRRGHPLVHALAQARAGDRPRRGRRRLRVPGHRRRCRHRRAAVRLVPHRRRRGLAVHRHREASRRAGRARLRRRTSHRSTLGEYSTAFLGFVRAVASGVMITAYCLWAFENATQDRRHHLVPPLDRAVRASRCCATRSSSTRAAAARPKRSCSATACSRWSA